MGTKTVNGEVKLTDGVFFDHELAFRLNEGKDGMEAFRLTQMAPHIDTLVSRHIELSEWCADNSPPLIDESATGAQQRAAEMRALDWMIEFEDQCIIQCGWSLLWREKLLTRQLPLDEVLVALKKHEAELVCLNWPADAQISVYTYDEKGGENYRHFAHAPALPSIRWKEICRLSKQCASPPALPLRPRNETPKCFREITQQLEAYEEREHAKGILLQNLRRVTRQVEENVSLMEKIFGPVEPDEDEELEQTAEPSRAAQPALEGGGTPAESNLPPPEDDDTSFAQPASGGSGDQARFFAEAARSIRDVLVALLKPFAEASESLQKGEFPNKADLCEGFLKRTKQFSEECSLACAAAVRSATILPEVKGSTTRALAAQVHAECFGPLDEIAANVLATRAEYYAEYQAAILRSVSLDYTAADMTTEIAGGALAGGVIGSFFDSKRTGAVIGALAGMNTADAKRNAAAERANQELQFARDISKGGWFATKAGMLKYLIAVGHLPPALLDWLGAHAFGGAVDLAIQSSVAAKASSEAQRLVRRALDTFDAIDKASEQRKRERKREAEQEAARLEKLKREQQSKVRFKVGLILGAIVILVVVTVIVILSEQPAVMANIRKRHAFEMSIQQELREHPTTIPLQAQTEEFQTRGYSIQGNDTGALQLLRNGEPVPERRSEDSQ